MPGGLASSPLEDSHWLPVPGGPASLHSSSSDHFLNTDPAHHFIKLLTCIIWLWEAGCSYSHFIVVHMEAQRGEVTQPVSSQGGICPQVLSQQPCLSALAFAIAHGLGNWLENGVSVCAWVKVAYLFRKTILPGKCFLLLPSEHPKRSREVCLSLSSLCFQKYAITFPKLASQAPILSLIIQMLTVVSTYFERGLIKYEIKGHLGGLSSQNKCGQKRRLFSKKAPVPWKSEEGAISL